MNSHHRRITQALNYLAATCGTSGTLNRMKAVKLIYFADRYHLRRYGRPLTDDRYVAMKKGSVGSLAKDISGGEWAFLDEEAECYAKEFLSRNDEYHYRSLRPADLRVLSESDLEALDFAIKYFGHLDQWGLADLTHAYPEWKKHEQLASAPGVSVPMCYQDFFEDPPAEDPILLRYCPDGDVFQYITEPLAKEMYEEKCRAEQLWD